jgi:hypothetical protein
MEAELEKKTLIWLAGRMPAWSAVEHGMFLYRSERLS